MTRSPLQSLCDVHLPALLDAAPDAATTLGVADRDERWGDPTEAGRSHAVARVAAWTRALDALPADLLLPGEDLDRRAFAAHAQLLQWTHEHHPTRRFDPDVLSGVARVLLRQRLAAHVPDEPKLLALTERLRTLPPFLAAARSVVTEPDARWSNMAAEVAGEFGAFLNEFKAFSRQADVPQALRTEFESALGTALQGAAEHLDWLRNLVAADGARWQAGEVVLTELFRLWRWPWTPTDLLEVARRAALDAAVDLRRACERVIPGGSLPAVLAELAQPAPAHPAEALAWVEQASDRAWEWLHGQDLLALPVRHSLVAMAAPPALRLGVAAPELLAGPRANGGVPGHVLAWLPDSSPVPLSLAAVESMALGRGVPGEHALHAHAATHTNPLRAGIPLGLYAEPAAAWARETNQGWGRYAEMAARRLGFRQSPGARVQLALDALRDAESATVDILLHTGRMTPSEARRRLQDTAHLDADTADRTVFRMTRHPGQACAPLVGLRMLEDARRRARLAWKDSDGPRRFHDLVLGHGLAPLAWLLDSL